MTRQESIQQTETSQLYNLINHSTAVYYIAITQHLPRIHTGFNSPAIIHRLIRMFLIIKFLMRTDSRNVALNKQMKHP